MVAWEALSAKLETDIDLQFSEPIVVSPYKKAAYMSDTIPDTSRQTRNTIGYRISKYTLVKSGGGGSAAFASKRTEADLLVEIREENVPDVRTDDRVLLRGANYDVSYVEYWGNGRNVLHLLKRH